MKRDIRLDNLKQAIEFMSCFDSMNKGVQILMNNMPSLSDELVEYKEESFDIPLATVFSGLFDVAYILSNSILNVIEKMEVIHKNFYIQLLSKTKKEEYINSYIRCQNEGEKIKIIIFCNDNSYIVVKNKDEWFIHKQTEELDMSKFKMMRKKIVRGV